MATRTLLALVVLTSVAALLPALAGGDAGPSVRSDDSPYSAVVQQLVARVNSLESKVTALESQLESEQQRTQRLEAEANRTVAFTAWMSHEPNVAASDKTTVPFNSLILNQGDAFSTTTSAFTAPYDGDYMFFVHADIAADYRGFSLVKSPNQVVVLCHNDAGDHRLACGTTMGLRRGDQVVVQHIGNDGAVDAGRETAFSGFRIR